MEKAIDLANKLLEDDPRLFYDEIQMRVYMRLGENPSLPTVARMMKDCGWDDKVAESRSFNRDPVKMKYHAEQRRRYDPRNIIYVDEAHKRGRDLRRRRGKGRYGKKAITPVSQHLAKNWTYLATMNYTGFVAWELVELGDGPGVVPSIDRANFMSMFRRNILPLLSAYIDDGVIRPNSIVVIDNCSLHHGERMELLEMCSNLPGGGAAKLVYTPPFCPDANAIELGFSQVRNNLERNRALANRDPAAAIHAAMDQCTLAQCSGFVRFSQRAVKEWRHDSDWWSLHPRGF